MAKKKKIARDIKKAKKKADWFPEVDTDTPDFGQRQMSQQLQDYEGLKPRAVPSAPKKAPPSMPIPMNTAPVKRDPIARLLEQANEVPLGTFVGASADGAVPYNKIPQSIRDQYPLPEESSKLFQRVNFFPDRLSSEDQALLQQLIQQGELEVEQRMKNQPTSQLSPEDRLQILQKM